MEAILAATQLYPENDWTGWQDGVNDDVFAQAPFLHTVSLFHSPLNEKMFFQVLKRIESL